MRPEIKSEFILKALDIFHMVQNGIQSIDFNQQTKQLYESIENTKEHSLIALEDLRHAIKDDPYFQLETSIYDVSDERFTNRFKSTVLTTKTFDFYVPIYCLYEFPKNMAIANTTVLSFEDLPKEIQDYFITKWEFKFSIDTEYHHKQSEYVNLKMKTTFIHFTVECNGTKKAIEKAKELAEDALHILRFVYLLNFNLIDGRYVIRENGDSGGMDDLAGLPFCGGVNYLDLWGSSIKVITKIFLKKKPNDIERRIKNAVRIFGTQTTIPNIHVRFLLLMTCLESLLMSNSDRDYILWKLAEKTAFLLGGNRRQTNDYIKEAYGKRSAFVHGDIKNTKPIIEEDIPKVEQIVGDVIWKLAVEFLRNGYSQIEWNKDPKVKIKSINEYIDQEKYGKEQPT